MTAAELINAGYRIHEVEVTYRILVLCKPDEAHGLNSFTVEKWCKEDGNEPEVFGHEVSVVPADWRDAFPFTTADIDGDGPTVQELLDAAKGAK
jgi:hypothetical protein